MCLFSTYTLPCPALHIGRGPCGRRLVDRGLRVGDTVMIMGEVLGLTGRPSSSTVAAGGGGAGGVGGGGGLVEGEPGRGGSGLL